MRWVESILCLEPERPYSEEPNRDGGFGPGYAKISTQDLHWRIEDVWPQRNLTAEVAKRTNTHCEFWKTTAPSDEVEWHAEDIVLLGSAACASKQEQH